MVTGKEKQKNNDLSARQQQLLQSAVRTLSRFVLESIHDVPLAKGRRTTDQEESTTLFPRGSQHRHSSESVSEASDVAIDGSAVFRKFKTGYTELMSESIRFDYAMRSLGSGGPGMDAASSLRKALRINLNVFESCEKFLFNPFSLDASSDHDKIRKHLAAIGIALRDLQASVQKFGTSLLEFVGIFYNEKLMRLLHRLGLILTSHLKTLNDISPLFSNFRDYFLDIVDQLAGAFADFTTHLADFVDKGVPLIRTAQQNQTNRYLNLTTISTFLSAVTVSTLQIVTQGTGAGSQSALAVAVNSFFFSSLVFSTASAVQSMLAMTWLRSFVRLPERHLPRWAFVWLTNGPTLSLLIAGAFFSMGLVLFAFSTKQDTVTSVLTTFFASIQALGVLFLAVWFYYERWRFRMVAGDTGRKLIKSSIILDTVGAFSKLFLRLHAAVKVLHSFVQRAFDTPTTHEENRNTGHTDNQGVLPNYTRRSDAGMALNNAMHMGAIGLRDENTAAEDPVISRHQDLTPAVDNEEINENAYQLRRSSTIDTETSRGSPPSIMILPPSPPKSSETLPLALPEKNIFVDLDSSGAISGQAAGNASHEDFTVFGGMIVDEPLDVFSGEDAGVMQTDDGYISDSGPVSSVPPRARRELTRNRYRPTGVLLSPGANERLDSISAVEMQYFGLS